MSIVCFHNPGSLDHRAFTMLGLSAKSDDKAIGFFGTGFKYAIATLLRHNCQIEVVVRNDDANDVSGVGVSGYTEYTFYTKPAKFRNKDHEFVYCMNSATGLEIELPFTTHFGANWKLWQAYRELFTNAKDEHGGVSLLQVDDDIHVDNVCVYVHGTEFVDIYHQHGKYFLEQPTLAHNYLMRAVAKLPASDNCLYYKTMYTGTRLDKPTYFTYDYLENITLTEDRTIADTWYIRNHITDVWVNGMSYEQLIEHLPQIARDEFYEYGLSNTYSDPSDDFNRACSYLIEHHRALPLWARDMYCKTLPFDEQVTTFKLNKFNKAQLKRAVDVMKHHDMIVDADKIKCVVSLPENVVGMMRDDDIYLAKSAFERGFLVLLGTLYEEYIHQTTRCEDMTRKMQNILIDHISVLMERVYVTEQED